MDKTALITGATKGIGLETARQLAARGIRVFLTGRDRAAGAAAEKEIQASGGRAQFLSGDVNRVEDRAGWTATIRQNGGVLDFLFNNAGVNTNEGWGTNTVNTVSMDDIRATFETNFFAVIEITRLMLPFLEKAKAGRIINLTSIMGSLALHHKAGSPIYDSKPLAYDASKTALNQYTVHLAHALRDTKIKVYAAHPGWVRTAMGTEYAPLDVTQGAETGLRLALDDTDIPSGSFVHAGKILPW